MKPFLFLFAVVLLGSCCPKVHCDIAILPPQIKVVYNGFTSSEVANSKIYITNSSYQVLDSATKGFGDNTAYIFQGMSQTQVINFYEYNYISSIAGRQDTISGIKYDQVRGQMKCGNCIFGNNMQTVTRYENLRYDYKGVTRNTDSLVIVK